MKETPGPLPEILEGRHSYGDNTSMPDELPLQDSPMQPVSQHPIQNNKMHQLLEWFPGIVESFNSTSKNSIAETDAEANQSNAKHFWVTTKEKERQDCFLQALEEIHAPSLDGWCGRIWDQLLCWPPTRPGTMVSLSCDLVEGFVQNENATRSCDENGEWAGNESLNSSIPGWTNYTACIDNTPHPEFPTMISEWLPMIKTMSIIGYSVSLVTLIISFSILASLRKLRCPRNILHLHLFASFMLRAVVVLIKSSLKLDEDITHNHIHHQLDLTAEADHGSWLCQLLIIVWQYFILANYSWILMEGLYLHNLIFLALFSDSSAITLYMFLGWGLPLACVSTWAVLRATLDNVHCWTVNEIQWIFWLCIRIPVALSNVLNFFFFINVTRVLLLKLRSSITQECMSYRKLTKSTLVLVPLFGVHYFLLWGLSVSTNARVELAWLLMDQVFSSFQGFFVAVLYCLMNGEVRQELRKLINRIKGNGLPELSYSTAISHTARSYFSRGRTSIHSIHSTTDKRGERRTPSPSPQMARIDGTEIRDVTPCSGKVPEFYSLNSCERKMNEGLDTKYSAAAHEAIEMKTTAAVSLNPIKTNEIPTHWEEAVPLISNHEPQPKMVNVPHCSRSPKEDNHERPQQPSLWNTTPANSDRNKMEDPTNAEINGMYGNGKDILVKVNIKSLNSSAQCSLIENEARQGESML